MLGLEDKRLNALKMQLVRFLVALAFQVATSQDGLTTPIFYEERICKTYPEIAAYPKSAEAIDRLIAAAEELWTEIEDDVVKNVIKSMPDRLNECYRANGYYTKY
ncbi:uncharacterized protein FFE2_10622 [Fusarium fujikuroi]|nr:uncharacterized protein FFE2_10622 [Fusarium fujikuroi]